MSKPAIAVHDEKSTQPRDSGVVRVGSYVTVTAGNTRRVGYQVEILGGQEPLSADFVPSNEAKSSKLPVR